MAVFFRCVIIDKNVAELEIKMGAFIVRLRLSRVEDVGLLVETGRHKKLLTVESEDNDFNKAIRKDVVNKTKDILELILAFLDTGLPPRNVIELTAFDMRLLGWSNTLKSTFIINICANENTLCVDNSVIGAKNTFFVSAPIMPLAFISVGMNVKIFGILAYVTRILLSR